MTDYNKIPELFDHLIERGELAPLQELVEEEGGPEYIDAPLVQLAVSHKKPEMLEWLLGRGFSPHQTGGYEFFDERPALFWATFSGNHQLMEILIRHGASLAFEIDNDHTSLHAAAENGDLEALQLLLERADGRLALEVFDYIDRTPLGCAVDKQDLESARLLIAAGADVNALVQATRDNRIGDPPIRRALRKGDVLMARLLLDHGADPDRPGWMWCTARTDLHDLEGETRERMAELLDVPPLKKLKDGGHQEEVDRQLLADARHHGIKASSLSWRGARCAGDTAQLRGGRLAPFANVRLLDDGGAEIGHGDFDLLVLTRELDFRAFWTGLRTPGRSLQPDGQIPRHILAALSQEQQSWIVMDCRNRKWRLMDVPRTGKSARRGKKKG